MALDQYHHIPVHVMYCGHRKESLTFILYVWSLWKFLCIHQIIIITVLTVKLFHLSVLSRIFRCSWHVGFHWTAYTVPEWQDEKEHLWPCNIVPNMTCTKHYKCFITIYIYRYCICTYRCIYTKYIHVLYIALTCLCLIWWPCLQISQKNPPAEQRYSFLRY